jgi:hypothetical protein
MISGAMKKLEQVEPEDPAGDIDLSLKDMQVKNQQEAGPRPSIVETFDINIIYDSFLLCIEKILQLLFFEKGKKAMRVYDDIQERLGEAIQPLVMRSMLNFSKNFKSGLMTQHYVRSIMNCYSETAYVL